jgi:hypothetical protein
MELFDLKADPSEHNDLAPGEPGRVAALRGKLEAWRRSVKASMPKANPAFEPKLWTACYETFDPSRVELRGTAAEMAVSMELWRKGMSGAAGRGKAALESHAEPVVAGLVHLEARDAQVHGDKLRYENPPQKDTLGFWVNPADYAEWDCTVPQAGRYAVEVLQGCVKGGSLVDVKVGEQSVRFTVEDTGHFQRFVPRRIGVLDLPAGKTVVSVKPFEKRGGAVMDLRRVTLVRVE